MLTFDDGSTASLASMVNVSTEDRMEALTIALENCNSIHDAMAYWSDYWFAWQSALRRGKIGNPHNWNLRLQMIERRCEQLRGCPF